MWFRLPDRPKRFGADPKLFFEKTKTKTKKKKKNDLFSQKKFERIGGESVRPLW